MGEKVVVSVYFKGPDQFGYGIARLEIHPGDIQWEGPAGLVDPKEVYQVCLGTVVDPCVVDIDVFREGVL